MTQTMIYYLHSTIQKFIMETKQEKINEVIFIGHYEKDNRDEYINYLFNNNIKLLIAGPEQLWKFSKINSVLKNK